MANGNSPYVKVSLKTVKNKETKEDEYVSGSLTFSDSNGKVVTLSGNGQTEANMPRALAETYSPYLDIVGEASSGVNEGELGDSLIPQGFPYRDVLAGAGITNIKDIPGKKSQLLAIPGVDENIALEIAVARNELAKQPSSRLSEEEFE